MRILLTILTLWCLFINTDAQPYRNEWIDYSKTYYKFPVKETRLYRISKAVLNAAGLGNVPAEQFQMWRNGEEVALFTTQETGPLANDGFIEFLGRMQDGKPDAELFDKPESQVLYDLSYFSDTAWHYLTVNTAGNNKRITAATNTAASTTLPVDRYYIHNHRNYLYYTWNYGEAMNLGITPDNQYPANPVIRSSLFNGGEGWTGQPFNNWFPLSLTVSNMQLFPGVGNIEFSYSVSGNYGRDRNVQIFMNDSLVTQKFLRFYTMGRDTIRSLPTTVVKNDGISFKFSSDNDFYWENCLINVFALKYPRKFNFLNSGFAEFNLQANTKGNYLKLGGFRSDNQATILYDLTNLKRYTATPKADSSFFAIDGSTTDRTIIISNQVSFLNQVTTLTRKNFIPYPTTQSDYLIITNSLLRPKSGTDFIEEYRKYRSSAEGGNYNAKIYDIDELAEQFAYGLRKHPLAIRNFVRYANDKFAAKPKYLFLIGKGTQYEAIRATGDFAGKEIISAVPTFGIPYSDNLLASSNNIDATPIIPVGRISCVSNDEVGIYYNKVLAYEALLRKPNKAPREMVWQKRFVHLVGSSGSEYERDAFTKTFIRYYSQKVANSPYEMSFYMDTLDNRRFAYQRQYLQNLLDSGVGVISFFGHSSTSGIDFGMKSPNTYPTQNGKYPIALANGCRAGNIFEFNTNRIITPSTSIADSYIFAPDRGSIVFVSNTDNGAFNYQNIFTDKWYDELLNNNSGKSIGVIQRNVVMRSTAQLTTDDKLMQSQCQQSVLIGDPAIVPYPSDKPDYAIANGDLSIQPVDPSVADDAVWVTAKFHNIGKGNGDTVLVELKRRLSSGDELTITRQNIIKLNTSDSVRIKMSLRGMFEEGANQIIATADVNNTKAEMSEANNSTSLTFNMNTNAAIPVFPYDLSIVNTPSTKLTASTANPIAQTATYRFQVDTSRLFNSSLLRTFDTTTVGGAISVLPNITYRNNTVYYWRVSPVNANTAVQWQNASFLYSTDLGKGYNQSHYFQHKQSSLKGLALDSVSRALRFGDVLQHLFVEQGIYNTSGTESSHFSVVENGLRRIVNACLGQSIIFNVFDPITFKPWDNTNQPRFGSAATCGSGTEFNFEFKYFNHANRKLIMDFLDSIPKGTYVVARLVVDPPYDSLQVQYWKRDTAIYGKGNSLYHSLVKQGFKDLDSLNRTRTFAFVFKKDDSISFKPYARMSEGIYDRLNESVFTSTYDTSGTVTSPLLGPASQWQQLYWSSEPTKGSVNPPKTQLRIYGVTSNGVSTQLDSLTTSQTTLDISRYQASQYPWIQLQMKTEEFKTAKPSQLNYWRATYLPVADGALSGKDYLVWDDKLLAIRDTLKLGIAFRNVSDYSLDSTNYTLKLGGPQGSETIVQSGKLRSLKANDTALINYAALTDGMVGRYYLKLEVNGEKKPTEQAYFNNTAYLPFRVDTSLQAVELVDFNVSASTNKVNTAWSVNEELKVGKYEVLYGIDSMNMQVILSAQPVNKGQSANYQREHLSPVIGKNYYRLRITDLYGNTTSTEAKLLEVALIDFDAQPTTSNNISSSWKTKNEVKFDSFRLEHSTNRNNWNLVATKQPTNTGTFETPYNASHSNPSLGVNYYRLNYKDQYGNNFSTSLDSIFINLTSFDAAVAGNAVTLAWNFQNEINIKDYQLEESDDSLRFKLMQTQNPTRNSAGTASYSITKSNVAFGFHYYRVKTTDGNGNLAYSAIRKVFVGDPTIVVAYPNPFTDQIRIVTGDLTNSWQMQLYDVLGHLLLSKTGVGPTIIPTSNLVKGMYFLKYQKGDEQQIWKLQKR